MASPEARYQNPARERLGAPRRQRRGLQFAQRDTGLDLERLHLTADDLARHSPGLILDQELPNGDRLLVWTE